MPRIGKQNGVPTATIRAEKYLINAEEAADLLNVGAAKIKRYCSDRLAGVDNGFPVAFGKHVCYLIDPVLLKEWVHDRVRNGEPI